MTTTADENKSQTEPSEAFLAELAERSDELETATPQEIVRWAVERFGDGLTMATAFGPEGMTLIHMLSEVGPQTHIFNLDTGYQFKETLELREQIVERYGVEVELMRRFKQALDPNGLFNAGKLLP